MKRRDALKGMLGLSVGSMGLFFGHALLPRLQVAQAATGKTLVVVFQRGGCDGLNTCIPYGDDNYYKLRPTIGISPPNVNDPTSAIDLDGFFGLHPGLAPFQSIYQAGDMAVLPATHYPSGSHSHFDGQNFIESAARIKNSDGWLNRHLQTHDHAAPMRAVAFGNDAPQSLRGVVNVSSFRNLNSFNLRLKSTETDILSNLSKVFNQQSDSSFYKNQLNNNGNTLINDLSVIRNVISTEYTAANGAVYPDNDYGRQLLQTAQLIKANVGLEVATVSIGGWDTHHDQGGGESSGKQTNLHESFSSAIAALYADLGTQMQDVVILTCTEFGRTVKENASFGTDHGNGATWFVIGGGVNGGIHGAWPGLTEADLIHGRFLDFSIDYRDVIGDVVSRHLGNGAINGVIQDHTYSPVGLFT